jgi:hypothetical protein
LDTIFPLGFPFATAFYMTLFVLTLVVHVVFMNYVLAGVGYLAVHACIGQRQSGEPSVPSPDATGHHFPPTVAGTLVDWMPTMLSAAITAGVAPLLFVQILYQEQVYTANLLMFNRWMSILPVLIVGFYALYLLKSHWLSRWPAFVRLVVAVFPFLCVFFTAYTWTEEHLLSVRGTEFHRAFYQTERQIYFEPQMIPRLSVWALGALPTMAMFVGWQLWAKARAGEPVPASEPRLLANLALGGLAAALVGGVAYCIVAPESTRNAFFSTPALPYFLLAVAGVPLQVWAWLNLRKRETFLGSARWLGTALTGTLLTILGMSTCREVIRVVTLGDETMQQLYARHAQANETTGLIAFLIFTVLVIGLVVVCFVVVQKGKLKPTESAASST